MPFPRGSNHGRGAFQKVPLLRSCCTSGKPLPASCSASAQEEQER